MREVNTGNILPFYKVGTHQSEVFFQSTTRHFVGGNFSLVPFQLILPSGGSSLDFRVVNADTGVFATLITPTIRSTSFLNIYTYLATSDLSSVLSNCQYYQINVLDSTTNALLYVSEKIFVKSNWTHTIEFTNNTDIGNVMYQTGYTQKFYFDGFEDVPVVDEIIGLEIDLSGMENVTSYRQTERRKIECHTVLDSQLTALQKAQPCRTIRLIDSMPQLTTAIKRLKFEHSPSVDAQNIGVFQFEIDLTNVTGCGENTYLLI